MGKRNPKSLGAEDVLHGAARSGGMKAVTKICSSNPLAVNARDRHSRTPLHLAAYAGKTEIVEFLSKIGDVRATALDDMGAIHFAAQRGHTEIVKILVAAGVPIESCTGKGMTALHFAAKGSHLELVKYLVSKGADVNSTNIFGSTPAGLASSPEVCAALAEAQPVPTKPVTKDKEKDAEAQDNESAKRKSSEKLPKAKKAKVALKKVKE